MFIKERVSPSRKLDVTYFSKSGLFVREVSCGATYGVAVVQVIRDIFIRVRQHRPFVRMSTDDVYQYGTEHISAPDVTVA